MDTIVQECKKCGYVTDCIEGICLECRLEKKRIEELESLKQQRDDLRDNLQAIVDDATEQVKKMVSFKQTRVFIKLKLIANAKAEIAKCEA